MTFEVWPCWSCGSPGVRNLGTRGYCSRHLGDLYALVDPCVFEHGGVGLQSGPMRPEYGPLEADLACCRCGATWTGIPGDACWWCRRYIELMAEHQAKILLIAPDVLPDCTFDRRMRAWADRLVNGVRSALITERQARTVWDRACKKVNRAA